MGIIGCRFKSKYSNLFPNRKDKNKHNNDQKLTESEKSSNVDSATNPENDGNETSKCLKKKKGINHILIAYANWSDPTCYKSNFFYSQIKIIKLVAFQILGKIYNRKTEKYYKESKVLR